MEAARQLDESHESQTAASGTYRLGAVYREDLDWLDFIGKKVSLCPGHVDAYLDLLFPSEAADVDPLTTDAKPIGVRMKNIRNLLDRDPLLLVDMYGSAVLTFHRFIRAAMAYAREDDLGWYRLALGLTEDLFVPTDAIG